MNKKSIIKMVAFLIITFSLFQLISVSFVNVEDFINHSQNSKVFISKIYLNKDTIYNINREQQKISINKTLTKTSFGLNQVYDNDIYPVNISFHKTQFGSKKFINISTLHYFHGSKYKDKSSVI